MNDSTLLTFGTFKGKSLEWLYDHERDYFNWVFNNCKNQKGLRKQMKKVIKTKEII